MTLTPGPQSNSTPLKDEREEKKNNFHYFGNDSVRRFCTMTLRKQFSILIDSFEFSSMMRVSLPFYLFHFETFFRRFVVAAAWLLEIFFVDFHTGRNKRFLPFKNRKKYGCFPTKILLYSEQTNLSIQLYGRLLGSLCKLRLFDAKSDYCQSVSVLVCAVRCNALNTAVVSISRGDSSTTNDGKLGRRFHLNYIEKNVSSSVSIFFLTVH